VAETTVSFDFDSLERVGECEPDPREGADRALVAALQRGAEEAYETLIARFQQPVYSLVSRLLDDPSEASDVVQDVFVKIYRSVGSFRGRSSLKTWIYRIAVNEARNRHRWFWRHRRREVCLESGDGPEGAGRSYGDILPDAGHSPYDLALQSETHRVIEGALARLKPVFREAVVLRDVEDLSYEEIAQVLKISLGTVKSRILRGREALRVDVEDRLDRTKAIGWTPLPADENWKVAQ
jgi:RNA polymerase sigma-70 factor (ECF subfamily)